MDILGHYTTIPRRYRRIQSLDLSVLNHHVPIVLVIGAQQANHVSDGTYDLIQNLFTYYILVFITLY